MKKLLVALGFALMSGAAAAQVYVQGYTRKDGTYVAPHVRSAPNGTKADNFGPSTTAPSMPSYTYASPYARDADRDGLANKFDRDDDADGSHDDRDRSQYSPRRW